MLKHGHTRGRKVTREYRSWQAAIERCYDPKRKDFPGWGGRGVTVSKQWLSPKYGGDVHGFERFLAHMGPRPAGTSLDRWPNPAGNYEPGNVRWATREQQQENRRLSAKLRPAGFFDPPTTA